MSVLWSPLFSFAVFALIFSFGDFVANKTKGLVSTIVVGCLIYLLGFWTGIIPTDSIVNTGFPGLMGSFGVALMITNLGSMINLGDFLKEWKTVVISVFGLVGLGIGAFTIGTVLFGKVYSLAAAAPISGGIIAGTIVKEAADAVNRPEIGGYAMLLVGFQMFIGMPISSMLLRKEAEKMLKNKAFDTPKLKTTQKSINLKVFPDFPPSLQSDTITLGKLALVALLGFWISSLTKTSKGTYILDKNIMYLICGLLFTELGFVDRYALKKANASGLLMLGVIAILPGSLTAITPTIFKEMLFPIIGTLVLGAVAICLFSFIMGKIVGYSPAMSMAIGLTAMVAYPGTQIITEEVVKGLDCSEEEKQKVKDYMLPKMLVGGFATVTIASVVFTGIIAPMIFS